jgi:hypothetical protein
VSYSSVDRAEFFNVALVVVVVVEETITIYSTYRKAKTWMTIKKIARRVKSCGRNRSFIGQRLTDMFIVNYLCFLQAVVANVIADGMTGEG